jgi:hypothetical protein
MEKYSYEKAIKKLRAETSAAIIRKKVKTLLRRADRVIDCYGLEVGPKASATVLLMKYVALHLARIPQLAKGPNDFLAYTVRCLLESSIWCEAIRKDQAVAEKLFDDVFIEERELNGHITPEEMGIIADFKGKLAPPAAKQLMKLGIDPVKVVENLQRHVIASDGRRTRIEKRTTKPREPHIFKTCSKFLHPSAWILANLDRTLRDDAYRRVFLSDALAYAEESIADCEIAMSDQL